MEHVDLVHLICMHLLYMIHTSLQPSLTTFQPMYHKDLLGM